MLSQFRASLKEVTYLQLLILFNRVHIRCLEHFTYLHTSLFFVLRREWDSNPRAVSLTYHVSSVTPSPTWVSLLFEGFIVYFCRGCPSCLYSAYSGATRPSSAPPQLRAGGYRCPCQARCARLRGASSPPEGKAVTVKQININKNTIMKEKSIQSPPIFRLLFLLFLGEQLAVVRLFFFDNDGGFRFFLLLNLSTFGIYLLEIDSLANLLFVRIVNVNRLRVVDVARKSGLVGVDGFL